MRLAAQLASTGEQGPGVTDGDVEDLERRIDRAQGWIAGISSFQIPGSSRPEVLMHGARVVCRRAERRVVALAASTTVPEVAVRFTNRLSDLLFVLARLIIDAQGIEERLWRRD
ncbi:MAG: ATP:cob(I)alamin adenosyltransferase, partial [Deltaproteobacteria bacterium]|nr:ATP:cob(I)alamin adenosyltransferase [Deltaproteobacteria bacterium]